MIDLLRCLLHRFSIITIRGALENWLSCITHLGEFPVLYPLLELYSCHIRTFQGCYSCCYIFRRVMGSGKYVLPHSLVGVYVVLLCKVCSVVNKLSLTGS